MKLGMDGSLVRDSLEALHCVLQQDVLSSAGTGSTQKQESVQTWLEKIADWYVMLVLQM